MKQNKELIFTGMRTLQLLEWCVAIADKPWRKQVNVLLILLALLLLAFIAVWFISMYINVYIPIGCLLTKFIADARRL